ncbi:hypothetical protein ACEN9J_38175 [Variovorax sp. Varisp41]|uniref:hypothetical protein n=1 Tax=Variovorax sp. Varisp41 TaxID=3243033 RepID=UPI0039B4BF23
MSVSKIKIKLGPIEVEYEGSEDFLRVELPALLSAVAELYQKSNIAPPTTNDAAAPLQQPAPASVDAGQLQMTTGTIAARLQVKSGSELVLAAAAHLALVKRLPTFSRQTLIDEMRTATSHFKQTYVNNLSRALYTLTKESKLNEPSKNTYALTAAAEKDLRASLAQ